VSGINVTAENMMRREIKVVEVKGQTREEIAMMM
jgi:hypothetical protein